MRASGGSGELRVGYQWAASLGPWEMHLTPHPSRRQFAFSARVTSTHDYWLQQRPLDLVLSVGPTEWVWRDVRPTRDEDRIAVVLTERPVVSDRVVAKEP